MKQQLFAAVAAFKGAWLACLRALPSAFWLRLRVKAMCYHLRLRGLSCSINHQYRDPRVAHRWSTAHGIVSGRIGLPSLRALQDGRDKDGNLWYRPEWERAGAECGCVADCPEILENAKRLGSPNCNYAEEGFGPTDYRRLPNGAEVPVSRHVDGCAIDLGIDWSKLGGPWSAQSIAIVERFALVRPYREEDWHLELQQDKRPQFSLFDLLNWMVRSKLSRTRR